MKNVVSILIIFLIAIWFAFLSIASESEQEIVSSFKQLVSKAIELTENYSGFVGQILKISEEEIQRIRGLSRLGFRADELIRDRRNNTDKWFRDISEIKNVSYDVQRTDSLISPYMGIVTGYIRNTRICCFDIKSEAEQSLRDKILTEEWKRDKILTEEWKKFKLTYAYQDSKWILNEAKYFFMDQWQPLWKKKEGQSGVLWDFWSQN